MYEGQLAFVHQPWHSVYRRECRLPIQASMSLSNLKNPHFLRGTAAQPLGSPRLLTAWLSCLNAEPDGWHI